MLLPFGGDALARGKFMKIAVKACEQEAVPADADLTFASMDEFTAALPDRSYGLLCLMAQHEPETIAALPS